MRREGFEFQVSRPEVILKRIDDVLCEPIEHVIIDVPEEYVGVVIENLGQRKGEMKNMIASGDNVRLEFLVPSRGLIGFRSEFMTQTTGTGILHHNLHGYEPFKGDLPDRTAGRPGRDGGRRGRRLRACSACRTAAPSSSSRARRVYAGMVVGENTREQDIPVNVCKTKQLTNIRAAGSDEAVRLEPPRLLTLDQAIEWLGDDEYLEVTPKTIRIRKRPGPSGSRARAELAKAAAAVG